MKLPERRREETLAFYGDTLGLPVLDQRADRAVVDFGPIRLNMDRVPHQSQPDICLQVQTPETGAARTHLQAAGVTLYPEGEQLPEGFDGFWIAAPSGTIHLIDSEGG